MTFKLFTLLLQAAVSTIGISLVSIAIGFVIAILLSAATLSGKTIYSAPARLFVSFFRGVPLLVQLLLIYTLLPAIGPAIIWAPVSLYLLATGSIWQAVVVIASGVLLVPSDGSFTITTTTFSGLCKPGLVFQVINHPCFAAQPWLLNFIFFVLITTD